MFSVNQFIRSLAISEHTQTHNHTHKIKLLLGIFIYTSQHLQNLTRRDENGKIDLRVICCEDLNWIGWSQQKAVLHSEIYASYLGPMNCSERPDKLCDS